MDNDHSKFLQKTILDENLAYVAVRELATDPSRILVIDCTRERKEMSAGLLLATAWHLSQKIKTATDKKRIGLVFPPGMGTYIANLAVVLCGKIPVNLNFTIGRAPAEASIEIADIDIIISADPIRERLKDFPWLPNFMDLPGELATLPKEDITAFYKNLFNESGSSTADSLGLSKTGGDKEVALLFTSGSSGNPKGVALTHRNLLSNCAQIDEIGILPDNEILLGNLPTFHSFGFTVALWFPIITGLKTITTPSPIDTKLNSDVIRQESVSIILGTPTFFKPYLTRVDPEAMKTVKFVISGAEKTPKGLPDEWFKSFGSEYLEGYGLTETSPVTSINLHKAVTKYPKNLLHKKGSTGRILPGMTAKIVDPDTGKERALTEVGILHLQGPNIFHGYLNDSENTKKMLKDNWLITGDLARFDDDGFLYIEGRLSRFSKIGGEMVPHGTLEEAIVDELDLDEISRSSITHIDM